MSTANPELEDDVLRLQLASLLLDLPLLTNEQVPIVLGISLSAWYRLKRTGAAPPCVILGGRSHYRTADIRAWVDGLEAKKNPDEDVGVPEGGSVVTLRH